MLTAILHATSHASLLNKASTLLPKPLCCYLNLYAAQVARKAIPGGGLEGMGRVWAVAGCLVLMMRYAVYLLYWYKSTDTDAEARR